jgi:hypothetical protein
MTSADRMKLFDSVVDQLGPTAVGNQVGKSASAISQIRNRKYAGSPDNILELVDAEYGSNTVDCPVMGTVPLARCIEERNKPFRATNPQRRALYQACRICKHRR